MDEVEIAFCVRSCRDEMFNNINCYVYSLVKDSNNCCGLDCPVCVAHRTNNNRKIAVHMA